MKRLKKESMELTTVTKSCTHIKGGENSWRKKKRSGKRKKNGKKRNGNTTYTSSVWISQRLILLLNFVDDRPQVYYSSFQSSCETHQAYGD